MKNIKIITSIILLFIASNLTFAFKANNNTINSQIVNPPLIEGYFYRDNRNDKVYWLVSGILHHIVEQSTYYRLFSNPENYIFNVDEFQSFVQRPTPQGTIIGTPIFSHMALIHAGGTVYFRTGADQWGIHFVIPNPQVMDIYHFNWNTLGNSSYDPKDYPLVKSNFPSIF